MAGSSRTAYSTSYDHLPIPTLSKLEIGPECFIPSGNWPRHSTIDFNNLSVYMDYITLIDALEMCINHNFMKYKVL